MTRDEIFKEFNNKSGKSLTQMKRYLTELGLKSPYPENTVELLLELSEKNDSKEVWNKGISLSEETKQKIAQSKKGGTPWNKGKTDVQVAWNKGTKLSDETKEKISSTLQDYYKTHDNPFKGKSHTQKCRTKMSLSHTGVSLTEEHKKSIKSSVQEFYDEHPEVKAELSKHHKNYHKKLDEKANELGLVKYSSDDCKVSGTTASRRLPHTKIGTHNYFTPEVLETAKKLSGTSLLEQEVQDFVKSICSDCICNDRTAIAPKELDIFIPSKNVAIEFDGLYWHSNDEGDRTSYHLQKTLMCEEKGIRLMHIFEDEWRDKQEIVKSMIASSIGVYQRKIPARKCTFTEVEPKIAKKFVDENHIQGAHNIGKAFGLYYEGELVQVATFRKNFAQRKDKELELGRMCSKLNTQVLGGFSKLMKESMVALKETKCTSFVDRRLFNASGYKSSGWFVIGESAPRYFYTDGHVRENRQNYMKQTCLKRWPEYDVSWTEERMCYDKGLRRIYDCGCIKVEYVKA